jgi:CRP/FNR family transcriptional regulator, dissimilatory nitrate respiration regulator
MSKFSPDSLAARLIAALPPSRVSRLRLDRGAAVFRQGDPASAVYVVEAGRVQLKRISADGAPLTLHVADAGESFAEASLSATHYHCDAIAETASVVLVLPKADLLTLMTTDPARGMAFTLAFASQVRDLRAKLELRNVRSAKERVLAWLRLRADGDPPSVLLNRSWTLIAEELGLTREAVYRALAMLERERRIGRRDGVISLQRPGRRSQHVSLRMR